VRVAMVAEGMGNGRTEEMVTWTYATHAENDAQRRDVEVDREVATLYAARARAEATEANRHGDLDRARRVLERTADRIARYAGTDPLLRQLERDLRAQVPHFADVPLSRMSLKSALFEAHTAWAGRDPEGKARRQR